MVQEQEKSPMNGIITTDKLNNLNNNNMGLKFKERELQEVAKLMANLNWKWFTDANGEYVSKGIAVTPEMLEEQALYLYKSIYGSKDITESSAGGITLRRNVECPEIIEISFEIEIAEEDED